MKKVLYEKYVEIIDPIEGLEILKPPKACSSNNWLISIRLLDKSNSNLLAKRDTILCNAHKKNLLLRPSWNLLNTLPMYSQSPRGKLQNAEDQTFRIINLPSSPQLLKV